MSIPKEPRALMIQLMYLVLTAMLALNITKEVLDAFSTINTSIENSNAGLTEKNALTYRAFDKIADRNPDLKPKRDELYPLALQVKEESERMVALLEEWKQKIVAKGGGMVTENGVTKVKIMDDIDIPTRMFVEEKNGDKVRKSLEDYVTKILAIRGGNDVEGLKKRLPIQFPALPKTDNNPSGDWTFGTFHNIPVIAAITLFSKWQSDVRNSESLIVEDLMARVGEEVYDPEIFKLDGLMAVAVPNISYALEGDEITANIAMAAYDKSVQPRISSNRGAVPVKDGIGTLKFRASGTGTQTVKGTITVPTKGTKVETRPWEFSYTVGTSGASLQLDKMNVMYVGVPNPVTISASGYNLGDVSWDMPGAKITSTGPGKYDVSVDKPNYKGVDYVVRAKTKAGGTVEVAKGTIRIKTIPSPIIEVGNISSGSMSAAELKAQGGIAAKLENFDFAYAYRVTGYNLMLIPKGSDKIQSAFGTGTYFNKDQGVVDIIRSVKPGDRLMFNDIRIEGTGGDKRPGKGSVNILVK